VGGLSKWDQELGCQQQNIVMILKPQNQRCLVCAPAHRKAASINEPSRPVQRVGSLDGNIGSQGTPVPPRGIPYWEQFFRETPWKITKFRILITSHEETE
jgi:hypothetical protein